MWQSAQEEPVCRANAGTAAARGLTSSNSEPSVDHSRACSAPRSLAARKKEGEDGMVCMRVVLERVGAAADEGRA